MSKNFIGLRDLARACGLTLVLVAGDVSALFIVNLPWLRPGTAGQSTELYMNLTSTDGATPVAVRTDEAAQVLIRGGGKGARVVPACRRGSESFGAGRRKAGTSRSPTLGPSRLCP